MHIEEKLFTDFEREQLVECILYELLQRNEIINHLQTYIPNFDSSINYNTYKNNSIVQEIKDDVYEMVKEAESEIAQMSKVRNVKPKKSPDMGLSNYIEIKFHKPETAPISWRQRYKDLYYMNIKISDHFTFRQPSVTHRVDLINSTLNRAKESILSLVYNQIDLINEAEAEIPNYQ